MSYERILFGDPWMNTGFKSKPEEVKEVKKKEVKEVKKQNKMIDFSKPKKSKRKKVPRKKLECNFCGFLAETNYKLIRHIRTHTGERPFPCSYCDYRSTQKASLKTHIKNKHSKKEVCPFCIFSCHRKKELKEHIRTHL